MKHCRIALISMESHCGDTQKNLNRVCAYLEEAGEKGAEIAVFPEAALNGYCLLHAQKNALPLSHAVVGTLRRTAKKCGLTALVGMIEREGNQIFISQLVCGADGCFGVYRKTHLGAREKNIFAAGDSLKVFDAAVPLGVAICYDMHFPEAAAALRARGAKMIAAPHASPAKAGLRSDVWARYMTARAYDNRIYVACCNACGSNGCGVGFSGGAALYAPGGNLIAADFSGGACMLLAEAEPFCFTGAKNFPAHRRRELYD